MERENGIDLTDKEIIGKGSSAVIYDLGDDTCYKKIYNKDFINQDDQITVLETIKNLKLANFCKIKNITYNENGDVVGYVIKRYENQNVDILSLPKDYLLDSYTGLYYDLYKLAENFICVKDLKLSNVFINYDGIVVYDYDLYKKGDSTDAALINNRIKLNCLFNEILSYELTYKYNLDPRICVEKINELFNARTDIKTLEESLKNYNRIIDFIRGNYEKRR